MLDLQRKLLERAAEILGGEPTLCGKLGVSPARLRLWRGKQADLPVDVFLLLVDIVLRDDVARAAEDRREQPRAKTDGGKQPREAHG
jgi:hypothetical protein